MRATVLCLLLAGCGSPFDLSFNDRTAIDPPLSYAVWYAEVEACFGTGGDFGAVEWFVADVVLLDGVSVTGVIEFPNAVTIKESWASMGWVVKHEIAHHVTGEGESLHDSSGNVPCATPTLTQEDR